MTLMHFNDNTYDRPYIVLARDLFLALEHNKRVVALRHRDGSRVADDGKSLKEGRPTCIDLSYIPEPTRLQARALFGDELPEMCVAVLEPGTILIGIRRGESGYYQMYDGMVTGPAAKATADRFNQALGVSPQQREALFWGSMSGWDRPVAKPSCPLHAKALPYLQEPPDEA
jgi:hypothetical protein